MHGFALHAGLNGRAGDIAAELGEQIDEVGPAGRVGGLRAGGAVAALAGLRGGSAQLVGQVFDVDGGGLGHHRGVPDGVAELACVSRPVGGLQQAQVLEVPPGTVKSRLFRARGLLREAISKVESQPAIMAEAEALLETWGKRAGGLLAEG